MFTLQSGPVDRIELYAFVLHAAFIEGFGKSVPIYQQPSPDNVAHAVDFMCCGLQRRTQ